MGSEMCIRDRPYTFAGLLFGAMLPYAFSALTMSAVGEAAEDGGDSLLDVVRTDDVRSPPGTKETLQELVLDPLCCLLHHPRPELLTVSEAFLSLETVFQRG